jgi:phage regulator Rha-like protein
MNTNYLLFEDDNKIRETIIDKENRKRALKIKLDEIKEWYELERKVLEEKQRILKVMLNELLKQRNMKEKEAYESLS